MPNVENLNTLVINKLSKAQYDKAVEENKINPNELYMTPVEEDPDNPGGGGGSVDNKALQDHINAPNPHTGSAPADAIIAKSPTDDAMGEPWEMRLDGTVTMELRISVDIYIHDLPDSGGFAPCIDERYLEFDLFDFDYTAVYDSELSFISDCLEVCVQSVDEFVPNMLAIQVDAHDAAALREVMVANDLEWVSGFIFVTLNGKWRRDA